MKLLRIESSWPWPAWKGDVTEADAVYTLGSLCLKAESSESQGHMALGPPCI